MKKEKMKRITAYAIIALLLGTFTGFSQAEALSQIIFVADTGNDRIVKLAVPQNEPGSSPLHLFVPFKAAIRTCDVNKATSFILEPFADNYAEIFNDNIEDLEDLAENMGTMTLVSDDGGMRIYEVTDQNGFIFPVVFSKDDNGDWKIVKF